MRVGHVNHQSWKVYVLPTGKSVRTVKGCLRFVVTSLPFSSLLARSNCLWPAPPSVAVLLLGSGWDGGHRASSGVTADGEGEVGAGPRVVPLDWRMGRFTATGSHEVPCQETSCDMK